MSRLNSAHSCTLAALLWLAGITPAAALIEDFNTWTQFSQLAAPGLTSTVNSASQVTLSASGAVSAGGYVGYRSADGDTAADSTSGFYFSNKQDFQIAVDFNVTASNSSGLAGIGLAIGEDSAGRNAAGSGLYLWDNPPPFSPLSPPLFLAAATVDNQLESLSPGLTGATSGRFFISYDSASGNITPGVNTIQGSPAPSLELPTFLGSEVQNKWHGDNLIVAFVLRSEDVFATSVIPIPPLTSGPIDAVFSNFEVLAGTPVSAVPLPAAAWLFGTALIGFVVMTRRRGFVD